MSPPRPMDIVSHVAAHRKRSFWLAEWSYWWTLVARNGETLAHSENYSSADARDQTARLVAEQLYVPYQDQGRKL